MLEGIKFGRKIVEDAPTGLGPFTEMHPCTGTVGACSDEETKAFLKKQVYSHHATSTCAIGADNDPYAVLDSKFRVRGVRGLRVVDASVFPKVPVSLTTPRRTGLKDIVKPPQILREGSNWYKGAFPVIPTIILSEKASYDILSGLK